MRARTNWPIGALPSGFDVGHHRRSSPSSPAGSRRCRPDAIAKASASALQRLPGLWRPPRPLTLASAATCSAFLAASSALPVAGRRAARATGRGKPVGTVRLFIFAGSSRDGEGGPSGRARQVAMLGQVAGPSPDEGSAARVSGAGERLDGRTLGALPPAAAAPRRQCVAVVVEPVGAVAVTQTRISPPTCRPGADPCVAMLGLTAHTPRAAHGRTAAVVPQRRPIHFREDFRQPGAAREFHVRRQTEAEPAQLCAAHSPGCGPGGGRSPVRVVAVR